MAVAEAEQARAVRLGEAAEAERRLEETRREDARLREEVTRVSQEAAAKASEIALLDRQLSKAARPRLRPRPP